MQYDPRIKLDVFKEPTTYRNDYGLFNPDKRVLHTWPKDRTEPQSKKQPPFEREDHETYHKYHNDVYIPFDQLITPTPILHTIPNATFTVMESPPDEGKEEAIKTRPRRYVSPAISMDDIPEPDMRKSWCDYVYTSDWKKAAKEAAQPVTEHAIPNTTFEIGGDPVRLKTELYESLPPGWREKGESWDDVQNRACVDPTQMFWLNKDPPIKCGACTNPYKGLLKQEIKDEIAGLIQKDKLRLAHDIPVSGYAGYMPRLSKGVALCKTDLPSSHPFLTASQAVTQRYKNEN